MNQEIKQITRKTLIFRSGIEDAAYGLNHIEGCAHGCIYPCYAMLMKKRFGAIRNYETWIKPKIVGNALELLDKELPKLQSRVDRVLMCFSTDAFMYQFPEIERVTLKVLAKLKTAGIHVVIASKGAYPETLINRSLFHEQNEYGATIVSLSEKFQKEFEPYAAPIDLRINRLKKLQEAGFKTWVSMEPYPPPNIIEQDIMEILEEVSFVDRIFFGKWNHNARVKEFPGSEAFYNKMALQVIEFGQKRGINVHIKKGTICLGGLEEGKAQSTLLRLYANPAPRHTREQLLTQLTLDL